MRIKNFTVNLEQGGLFPENRNWLDIDKNFLYIYYDNTHIWNRYYWIFDTSPPEKMEFNDTTQSIIIEHLTMLFNYVNDYQIVKNNLLEIGSGSVR
jgi:hypothetical protein